MPTGTLTDGEYRALAGFRHELRRFLGFSEKVARRAGLEPRQHQLLLTVRGLPADRRPTIGEIADRLHVRHHSAVELVDRMEARGLVRRHRDAADRRQVLVRLTRRGDRLLTRLSLSHRAELRAVAPALLDALTAVVAGASSRRRRRPTAAA
ncbi:MAG TPA: MarR family winged helix-turn-helix transcriptional regulator [Candidatus Binatia bacterium]|nr:MarR family winged helix-turn-helix transcriptional regulator [Candidatus Binatia bacterium]